MQKARFRSFLRYVDSDEGISFIVVQTTVYWYYADEWRDENGEVVGDDALLQDLSRTLRDGIHWRRAKSILAYFPLQTLDSVVVGRFASPPTQRTRDKVMSRLDACLGHSNNEFDATHDALTGLLNGPSFERELGDMVDAVDLPEADTSSGVAVAAETVSLLALDIDYFKQVNDSYGHSYGDAVLQCLARRLESCASLIEREAGGQLRLLVARPSGEEFLICLVGVHNRLQAESIAERIRAAVAEIPNPSSEELVAAIGKENVKALTLPQLNDRRIAVSVGLASVGAEEQGKSRNLLSDLRSKADIALYCAKSGGRNRVRRFADILSHHGGVIGSPGNGVVIIDVGMRVGVKRGQEFLVYHPDFCGDTPFIVDDGRTRNPVGVYPRYGSWRIVAFDVQPRICVCRIIPQEGQIQEPIPLGSSVEPVSLGTIGHLIGSGSEAISQFSGAVASARGLESEVNSLMTAGLAPAVAIFGLNDESSLLETRGMAFINDALAKLYKAVRQNFAPGAIVGKTQETQVAVVQGGLTGAKLNRASLEAIGSAARDCGGTVSFSAGIFSKELSKKGGLSGDRSTMNPAHALDYARFAVFDALRKPGQVQAFSPEVASRVVYLSRKNGENRRALEDDEKLKELGVTYSSFENQAALAAFEGGLDHVLALDAVRRAIDLDNSEALYRANLGIILFEDGEWLEAHKAFCEAFEVEPGWDPDAIYSAAVALSMSVQYLEEPGTVSVKKLTMRLETARANTSIPRVGQYAEEIEAAISGLRSNDV